MPLTTDQVTLGLIGVGAMRSRFRGGRLKNNVDRTGVTPEISSVQPLNAPGATRECGSSRGSAIGRMRMLPTDMGMAVRLKTSPSTGLRVAAFSP